MQGFRALVALALAAIVSACASTGGQNGARPHVYAFGQPELLATQRVFGVGNAVTLLGDACEDDPAALRAGEREETAEGVLVHGRRGPGGKRWPAGGTSKAKGRPGGAADAE